MSLLTGDGRSATVRATARGTAVELSREALTAALARHPQLLANLARVLSRRLSRAHADTVPSGRGEAVGLVLTGSVDPGLADEVVSAARSSCPRPVTALRVPADGGARAVESVAASLDDLLVGHGVVLVVAPAAGRGLGALVGELDRTLVLGPAYETAAVEERLGTGPVERLDPDARRPDWLGRHVTRTKVGLALGAGGARGYAHVGVLAVLEEAGHAVDAVAGTDTGATVAACVALGMDSAGVAAALDGCRLGSGASPAGGGAPQQELFAALAGERLVEGLAVPFAAVATDLDARRPVALTSGRLVDALLASNALPGLVEPVRHAGRRLVDGVALAPVPVDAARALGADVVVAVNLLSRETLPGWPGQAPVAAQREPSQLLDTLLAVLDLTQLEASVRDAALADVVVTPRFGPSGWRDDDLAIRFLAAGRDAAAAALDLLAAVAPPPRAPVSAG